MSYHIIWWPFIFMFQLQSHVIGWRECWWQALAVLWRHLRPSRCGWGRLNGWVLWASGSLGNYWEYLEDISICSFNEVTIPGGGDWDTWITWGWWGVADGRTCLPQWGVAGALIGWFLRAMAIASAPVWPNTFWLMFENHTTADLLVTLRLDGLGLPRSTGKDSDTSCNKHSKTYCLGHSPPLCLWPPHFDAFQSDPDDLMQL